jgi:ferredoxin
VLVTIILAVAALILLAGLWLFAERGRFLRPSTWRLMREGGIGLDTLHAYVYGRWTNQYVGVGVHRILPGLRPRGKKWLSDHYHGKVLRAEEAQAIIDSKKDIPLQDLEQIIPYPVARNLVLAGPPDVAVYECGCRHAHAQPCQPTQVCMVIGQPFVDFILEHHPRSSRRLTQAEALELLRAEHQRGHLHCAWFKDAMMNRFYAICNCCKCCCGGVEAMTKYGIPMMASSGYVAALDGDLCNQCGACVDACPFHAVSMDDSAVVTSWELCMGCGVCVQQCPAQAMTLVRDEKKGVPLDVRVLT